MRYMNMVGARLVGLMDRCLRVILVDLCYTC
jgi:hypothetical protein